MSVPPIHSKSTEPVFLLTHEVPFGNTGGGVLLREIIRFLADQAELHVFVPVMPHLLAAYEDAQASLPDSVQWHRFCPRGDYGSMAYSLKRMASPLPGLLFAYATESNRTLLESQRRVLQPRLEIYVQSWSLAPCRDLAMPSNSLLYLVNVDHHIIRPRSPRLSHRLEATAERWKVCRMLRWAARSAGQLAAITEADRDVLVPLTRRKDMRVLPPLMQPRPVDRSSVQPKTLLITTNFSYSHNRESLLWFLDKVWPHVDAEARLCITGKDDASGGLRSLVAGRSRVDYLGCLPDREFDACFEKAALVINPTISGSGFQIKLLDALARGVPVVSTAFSNPFPDSIPSSDDPLELARLIKIHSTDNEHRDSSSILRAGFECWSNLVKNESTQ